MPSRTAGLHHHATNMAFDHTRQPCTTHVSCRQVTVPGAGATAAHPLPCPGVVGHARPCSCPRTRWAQLPPAPPACEHAGVVAVQDDFKTEQGQQLKTHMGGAVPARCVGAAAAAGRRAAGSAAPEHGDASKYAKSQRRPIAAHLCPSCVSNAQQAERGKRRRHPTSEFCFAGGARTELCIIAPAGSKAPSSKGGEFAWGRGGRT